jgi:hypothetical protein
MLTEIEGVRQDEPGRRRRWFHGDYFELFVWQTEESQVVMFQLCYGGATSERALVWREDLGFFHDGVSASPPGGDAAANRFPASMIATRFTEDAGQVPEDIRAFVLTKVADYSQSPPPRRTARSRFRREEWQRRAKA